MKQPGLDKRHRDADGEIIKKHGDTKVSTLRDTYGDSFAPGVHGNSKLSTVLQELDRSSLNQQIKNPPKNSRRK